MCAHLPGRQGESGGAHRTGGLQAESQTRRYSGP